MKARAGLAIVKLVMDKHDGRVWPNPHQGRQQVLIGISGTDRDRGGSSFHRLSPVARLTP